MGYQSYHALAYCLQFHLTRVRPYHKSERVCQRCNHYRLRLKWVEGKRVALQDHLARVRQDMCDDVAANYASSPVNHALGNASLLIALGPPRPIIQTPVTTGSTFVVPTDVS